MLLDDLSKSKSILQNFHITPAREPVYDERYLWWTRSRLYCEYLIRTNFTDFPLILIPFPRDFVCRRYRQVKLAAVIWWIYCRTMLDVWIWVSYSRITFGFYRFRYASSYRMHKQIVEFHATTIFSFFVSYNFQSILICYLIWQRIGWAAIVGVVGLLLKTVPVQTRLSHISSMLRMRVAVRTDDRVGIMNEIIQGIQVIKMYAWERPFQNVVAEARRLEVQQIRYASYIRGINVSTMVFIERSTLFITISACIMMGYSITADIVYSMAQYFNVLQLNAAIFYPMALSLGAEALVSIRRVEEFLLKGEKSEAEFCIERRGSGVLMDKKRMYTDQLQFNHHLHLSLVHRKCCWNSERECIVGWRDEHTENIAKYRAECETRATLCNHRWVEFDTHATIAIHFDWRIFFSIFHN